MIARLLVVGAIVLIGALVRDFTSGSAGDVRAGDCIDIPTSGQQTIKEVQHHPCDQAHTGEIFAVFDYSAAKDDPYPSQSQFDDVAFARCSSEFATYTGTSFEDRSELDMSYMAPTSDGWSSGDRTLTCVLYRVDGATMTSSMRKGG